MAQVVVEGNEIVVRSLFSERDLCKSVPGAGWDRTRRVWTYPLSVHAAKALLRVFGDGALDATVKALLEPAKPVELPAMSLALWQHQQDAIRKLAPLPGGMLAFDMGTGKSGTAIALCDTWGARRVLIVCPKSVISVWPAEIIKHSRRTWSVLAMDQGSVEQRTEKAMQVMRLAKARGEPLALVVNYDAIIREPLTEWLCGQEWDVAVYDECIPAGTMIATPTGKTAIETLSVGDAVLGFDEQRQEVVPTTIRHCFERETDALFYRVADTALTGNHPVYVGGRYVSARTLAGFDMVGVTMLQCSQEDNHATIYRKDVRVVREDVYGAEAGAAVLQQVVSQQGDISQSRVPQGILGAHAPTESEPDREYAGLCELRTQPLQEPRDKREAQTQGSGGLERDGLLSAAWRKWVQTAITTAIVGRTAGLANRICRAHGASCRRHTNMLQDRHSGTGAEDCSGSGWRVSRRGEDSGVRPTQDDLPGVSGLGCAAVPEQSDLARSGWRGTAGIGRRTVYNLETGTGNYFANDLLVHNCHHTKSPSGRQSRTAQRIAKRATHRLGLTGTPMPHSPLDIYAQYRAIDPSIFGTSYVQFRSRYAIMGGYGSYEVKGYQNQDELNERFYSIACRVSKRDVLDLPPVLFEDRYCTLDSKEAHVYNQLEREFYAWLDAGGAEVTVNNALVKLLRLQQVGSGYVLSDTQELVRLGRSKLDAFAEWLEDVPVAEPVVAFCRFVEDVEQVAYECRKAGRTVGTLYGGANELAAFRAGEVDTLVCQIQAGSEGIDLSRSALCVFFSVGFSLGQYDQALARVDRPGQLRPVTYIRFIAKSTVDEKCYQALANKREVVQDILKPLDSR